MMMMNYDNQIMSIIINHQDKFADQNNDKLFISFSANHKYWSAHYIHDMAGSSCRKHGSNQVAATKVILDDFWTWAKSWLARSNKFFQSCGAHVSSCFCSLLWTGPSESFIPKWWVVVGKVWLLESKCDQIFLVVSLCVYIYTYIHVCVCVFMPCIYCVCAYVNTVIVIVWVYIMCIHIYICVFTYSICLYTPYTAHIYRSTMCMSDVSRYIM